MNHSNSSYGIKLLLIPKRISMNNKSFFNSSNLSNSTMMSQNESHILTNLRKNKSTIQFQKNIKKIRNKIYLNASNKSHHNSYKGLIIRNPKKYIIRNALINTNIKYKTSTKQSNRDLKYHSSISHRITDILLEENYQGLNNFMNTIKSIIIVKKLIHEQKKNCEVETEKSKEKKLLIKGIEQKIKNLNYIKNEKEDILKINKYIKFLIEKRIELKYNNVLLFTHIDYLKNDIKELFIKIKTKSEKLWELFNIRNLLICIKEKILVKNLPLIFRVCDSSFLSTIMKFYNRYVELIETQKKEIVDDPLLNYHIPTNLVEYIHKTMKDKLDKDICDKKYLKYLDPKTEIFTSADEFISKYSYIENNAMNIYYYYSRKNSINNNYIKVYHEKLNVNKDETDNLIEYKEECTTKLQKLKQKNNFFKNYLKHLKEEYHLINFTESKYLKEVDNKLNKIFSRSIINSISPEKNKFYFYLNTLKNEKKFKIKYAYIYYIISKNTLEFYKQMPNFFHIQEKFKNEDFYNAINNINNADITPLSILTENAVYLMRLYESAILFFLNHLKNIKGNNVELYNNLNKEIILNKKINLVEFRKLLDEKITKIQEEKINKKNNKTFLFQNRKVNFPFIYKIKRGNKTEKKVKQNISYKTINPYSSIDYLDKC